MKDIQQVCLNGHQTTSFYNTKAEKRKEFCPICGAKTIINCPNCQKSILGGDYTIDFDEIPSWIEAKVPDYCENCGKPFPWALNKATAKNNNSVDLSNNKNVFIVHGQNEKTKDQVEEYISSIGYNPIILHKQANLGKTLIEKVEHYGERSSFAIILFTGDDLSCKYFPPPFQSNQFLNKKSLNQSDQKMHEYHNQILNSLKKRARQNVVFEFGYFIGLLGRERVIMLYENEVELPSDVEGFIHIKLDHNWKEELLKEIKAISSQ